MEVLSMKAVGSLFVTLTCMLAIGTQTLAQQATPNPLITLLQSKGILSADEAAEVSRASSPDESNRRLAQLLVEKGLISDQEYQTTFVNSAKSVEQGSRVAQFMSA